MQRRTYTAEEARALRRTMRRELRRARRYLRSLVDGLSDAERGWCSTRPGTASIHWHVGRAAAHERELLAMVVSGLETDALGRDQPFALSAPGGLLPLPSWTGTLDSLRAARRLSEALVDALRPEEAADLFLDVVNAEYAQAAAIQRLRHDQGLPLVPEPHGALLSVDTDAEHAPRFHLRGWEVEPRPRSRRRGAAVVVLAEHRRGKAEELIEEGHRLVAAGDHRGALSRFERSAELELTADAVTYQGWMHALLGDADRAERLCRAAIELDPEFGNPYNDVGTFCLQRREVATAVDWFEKAKRARRYEPRHFPFLNLGRLYLSLGMPEKALREFEGALEVAPGNAEAMSAVEQLRGQLERD